MFKYLLLKLTVKKKKSIEDLKNQANEFLKYADNVWLISDEERKKIFETLWIWEFDKKWFFDWLLNVNEKSFYSSKKFEKNL